MTDNDQTALQRIQQAAQSGATTLDLSRLDLTVLPPEIGQLTQLVQLYLGGNQLTALPPEIGALSALLERDPALEGAALAAATWMQVIEARVPAKYLELNRRAFEEGRRAVVSH